MIFYSGFALQDDQPHFEAWLDHSAYSIAGFSYGAIKAFEHAFASTTRIETLQLFSPAFFQTKKERYIMMQLEAYKASSQSYINTFLDNCFFPALNTQEQVIGQHSIEQLETLLRYQWEPEKLLALHERGVAIEVYLGGKDKIVDSKKAYHFFTPFATVFSFQDKGHFLK